MLSASQPSDETQPLLDGESLSRTNGTAINISARPSKAPHFNREYDRLASKIIFVFAHHIDFLELIKHTPKVNPTLIDNDNNIKMRQLLVKNTTSEQVDDFHIQFLLLLSVKYRLEHHMNNERILNSLPKVAAHPLIQSSRCSIDDLYTSDHYSLFLSHPSAELVLIFQKFIYQRLIATTESIPSSVIFPRTPQDWFRLIKVVTFSSYFPAFASGILMASSPYLMGAFMKIPPEFLVIHPIVAALAALGAIGIARLYKQCRERSLRPLNTIAPERPLTLEEENALVNRFGWGACLITNIIYNAIKTYLLYWGTKEDHYIAATYLPGVISDGVVASISFVITKQIYKTYIGKFD